jgi:hypothetical protein
MSSSVPLLANCSEDGTSRQIEKQRAETTIKMHAGGERIINTPARVVAILGNDNFEPTTTPPERGGDRRRMASDLGPLVWVRMGFIGHRGGRQMHLTRI